MFKHAATALVALSLVTTTAAMADSRDEYRGHRDHWDRHGHYERDHRFDRSRESSYREPVVHRHHWARGERLPVAYYSRPHIVNDYRVYDLRRPPRGCHWVRVGADAVLAAIATGVVLDVVYDLF
jgi:Ni/Co efflux regulator RcnB